ncbi:MAG: DUF4249 family protein [Bacteroidota bacterium]
MLKYLFIIGILLQLISCDSQEDVDITIPFQKKLVGGVIIGTSDATIAASLTYTTPVYNQQTSVEPVIVTNANAFVNEGSNQYHLTFDEPTGTYNTSLNGASVQVGQTYRLIVSDGNETVTGQTTIPDGADVKLTVQFDSAFRNNYFYHANFNCQLLSDKKQYIRLVPTLFFDDSTQIEMLMPSYTSIIQLNQGQSFNSNFGAHKIFQESKPIRIECKVLVCDEAYAKYFNTTTSASLYNVLPIGEPNFAYSNLSNKVGVIASYNLTKTFYFQLQ